MPSRESSTLSGTENRAETKPGTASAVVLLALTLRCKLKDFPLPNVNAIWTPFEVKSTHLDAHGDELLNVF
jgi:hypothetical protein